LRGAGKRLVERKIEEKLDHERETSSTPGMVEDQGQMLSNLLTVVEKWLNTGNVKRRTLRRFLRSFSSMAGEENRAAMEAFERKYGTSTPRFITISPTMRCNLRCTGCYACSDSTSTASLSHETFDRIIRQQKELWGSHFTVISGGEPFMWRDGDTTLLDVVADHPDTFFLVYTNGTLIDEAVAERMADLGNITPCVSTEGFEAETDGRRGAGVHKKVLQAFHHLHEAGVLYGTSITVTKENKDTVFSKEFIDYYFAEHGVYYGWIFQYMPVGRSYSLDLMPTPQQRVEMLEQMRQWIKHDRLFLADFWNSATLCNGCMSAGRKGGYVYIDWNGDVMPCVFNPYSTHNINDVFARGGTIDDVVIAPLMSRIREWQQHYYDEGEHDGSPGNMFAPCPLRDHHEVIRDIIADVGAHPTNESAEIALQDDLYRKGMVEYGRRIQELTNDKWRRDFLHTDPKSDSQSPPSEYGTAAE
jgi:MoaA/NifB/PqqE/SkfB family radical SAM enzyme